MKLVSWSAPNGFVVPMLEDDQHEMFCVTKGVASALGIQERSVLHLYYSNPEEFSLRSTSKAPKDFEPSVISNYAKEFLRKHKEEFGIKRMREDMHLWSEDDVLTFAMMCRTDAGRAARREFRKFIKENMRKSYVSREEYKALLDRNDELAARMAKFELAVPSITKAASAAGTALAAHKGTVRLRDLN